MKKIDKFVINCSEPLPEEILRTIEKIIQGGGLIICPTESSYLLGADAFNQDAVRAVYRVKNRPLHKPLPTVVADKYMAQKMVIWNERAEKLCTEFWPGPLTMVLPAQPELKTTVLGQTGTIGIRRPRFPVLLQILHRIQVPLISTSANLSGEQEPYSLTSFQVFSSASESIPKLIIDAGILPPNLPSTVIDISGNRPRLLREGSLPWATIMSFLSQTKETTQ